MAANTINLNVSLHALNAINAALTYSMQTFQNALVEVQMETQNWQASEKEAAASLALARELAVKREQERHEDD